MIDFKQKKIETEAQIKFLENAMSKDDIELKHSIKALWIFNKLKKSINDSVKDRIETIVTTTLQSVYGVSYQFRLELDTSRNSINYTPIIIKDGFPRSIEYGSGGGIADITSFAFRIALWALDGNRKCNTFIFDEPARNIGESDNLEKFSEMLTFLSSELKLQFIVITHKDKLAIYADRIFALDSSAEITTYDSYENFIKEKGEVE